jgi:hypothetical protein
MSGFRNGDQLDTVPGRFGGLNVVAGDLDWQRLVCGAVNDQFP